jgi:hypothetical protein
LSGKHRPHFSLLISPSLGTRLTSTLSSERLLYYFWSQTTSIDTQKRYHSNPVSAYDRPGTLSTHSNRLDGNLTGEPVPYWSPFDTGDLSPSHGRLLEKLFLSISSPPERIVDPVPISRIETVLFFGDSNERGIVDELCIKLGRGETWPTVISSKNAPTKSELWHADSHSCEIELKRERKKLRLVSFMNYGVLIEKDSKLWEKKLELDGGPWSIEERIELAKKFVESMGWGQIDLIVFNSSEFQKSFSLFQGSRRRGKGADQVSLLRSRSLGSHVSTRHSPSIENDLRVFPLVFHPRILYFSIGVRPLSTRRVVSCNSPPLPYSPPFTSRSTNRFLQFSKSRPNE